MKSQTIDMTHGSLADKLIIFALPLIATNMLQLLFNAADVIVVGRFAGSLSLAAVGSTTSVIFLFINVLMGLAVGVNVMVVPYFIYGMADVFVGAIRGTGHALSPVISTLLCTCLLRILWTLWLDTSRYGIEWVYYSYPVTWLLLLIVVAAIWQMIRKKAD